MRMCNGKRIQCRAAEILEMRKKNISELISEERNGCKSLQKTVKNKRLFVFATSPRSVRGGQGKIKDLAALVGVMRDAGK